MSRANPKSPESMADLINQQADAISLLQKQVAALQATSNNSAAATIGTIPGSKTPNVPGQTGKTNTSNTWFAMQTFLGGLYAKIVEATQFTIDTTARVKVGTITAPSASEIDINRLDTNTANPVLKLLWTKASQVASLIFQGFTSADVASQILAVSADLSTNASVTFHVNDTSGINYLQADANHGSSTHTFMVRNLAGNIVLQQVESAGAQTFKANRADGTAMIVAQESTTLISFLYTISPIVDNSKNCGQSALRWASVFGYVLDAKTGFTCNSLAGESKTLTYMKNSTTSGTLTFTGGILTSDT